LYLLSNIGNKTLEKLKLDYPDYFIHFSETTNTINRTSLGSHDLIWKPKLIAYQKALATIGKTEAPHLTIFVDDNLANVRAAYKIGLNAIQFKNQSQFENDLKNLLGKIE
jgi:FMN phosphatase YigB (HAD superfamily)